MATLFGRIVRRISHGIIPRADRPWEEDATSQAPSRKRRLSTPPQSPPLTPAQEISELPVEEDADRPIKRIRGESGLRDDGNDEPQWAPMEVETKAEEVPLPQSPARVPLPLSPTVETQNPLSLAALTEDNAPSDKLEASQEDIDASPSEDDPAENKSEIAAEETTDAEDAVVEKVVPLETVAVPVENTKAQSADEVEVVVPLETKVVADAEATPIDGQSISDEVKEEPATA
ncbi:hypothetical protein CYLTODRAFT_492404 [Cylindrobasidium torrendii FP15055 ss-10]|uniref:Uncharacterized protein n=1 Tax=Cylindrobasidium torrendii FP15055 ss-10 TaxID=1314674 RepID=A0A0D7B438_9AGAR|nr:hypothetical protein CYLTODRAFT_492404 [Cylindrobasidium torrendii FP15055 ss-10]